jgi:uncharacterized membrane protein YdjX (TVP38/TMEM64 family)
MTRRFGTWRFRIGILVVLFAIGSFVAALAGVGDIVGQARHCRAAFQAWATAAPVQTAALYAAVFVAFTALSLPGKLVLTVAGGALFGAVPATVLASFAATAGATTAFLTSRYLLRDEMMARFGARLTGLRGEVDRAGVWYLFALRLNPLVPYFLLNLLFGLTPMPAWQFWIATQLGMLPLTVLSAYAGAQLGAIDSLRDMLSGQLLAMLVGVSTVSLAAPLLVRGTRVTGSDRVG